MNTNSRRACTSIFSKIILVSMVFALTSCSTTSFKFWPDPHPQTKESFNKRKAPRDNKFIASGGFTKDKKRNPFGSVSQTRVIGGPSAISVGSVERKRGASSSAPAQGTSQYGVQQTAPANGASPANGGTGASPENRGSILEQIRDEVIDALSYEDTVEKEVQVAVAEPVKRLPVDNFYAGGQDIEQGSDTSMSGYSFFDIADAIEAQEKEIEVAYSSPEAEDSFGKLSIMVGQDDFNSESDIIIEPKVKPVAVKKVAKVKPIEIKEEVIAKADVEAEALQVESDYDQYYEIEEVESSQHIPGHKQNKNPLKKFLKAIKDAGSIKEANAEERPVSPEDDMGDFKPVRQNTPLEDEMFDLDIPAEPSVEELKQESRKYTPMLKDVPPTPEQLKKLTKQDQAPRELPPLETIDKFPEEEVSKPIEQPATPSEPAVVKKPTPKPIEPKIAEPKVSKPNAIVKKEMHKQPVAPKEETIIYDKKRVKKKPKKVAKKRVARKAPSNYEDAKIKDKKAELEYTELGKPPVVTGTLGMVKMNVHHGYPPHVRSTEHFIDPEEYKEDLYR